MRTTTIETRTYTGFDRRLIPNEAEVIAVALVVGDVVVFHLDGPEAVAEIQRYLEYEIEDGGSPRWHLPPRAEHPRPPVPVAPPRP